MSGSTRWPWWIQAAGILLAAFLAILIIGEVRDLSASISGKKPDNTIAVSAEGKSQVVPDIATVQLGVVTRSKTAKEAQTIATTSIDKITQFAKDLGIAREDITTTQASIYPSYNYRPDGVNEINEYESRQTVSIKVRGVDKSTENLTKLVGGAVDNGANEIYGTNFGVDDPDNARQAARLQAIEKAKQKAKELADAAGLKLGKVVSVSEGSSSGVTPPYPYYGEGMGGAMPVAQTKDASAPAYEPGSQEIIQSVTVIFEVK